MRNKFKLYVMVSVLFLLFLDGCATAPGSAHFLRTDSHSNDLYKAVLFGSVKFNAGFELYENNLFMALWRINSEPDPSNINLRTFQFNNPVNDKACQLEIPFALEVIPGTYDLRSVGLSSNYGLPERIRLSPKGDYVDNDKNKGYHKIQHEIQVSPGEMVYLGTISIDNITFKPGSLKTYNYTYNFIFEDNMDKDLKAFKKTYPAIFNKYKENIRKQF